MLLAAVSVACSLAFKSFCETCSIRPTHSVIRGVVIDTISRGIRLRQLNVIRGSETRDTLIIWDGTDIDCNGPFPQKANMMGQPGDTLLLVMSLIDSVAQPWQIIGDYMRPDDFGYTPWLRYEDDTLLGYVSGNQISSQIPAIYKMHYSDWLTYWNAHGGSCNTLVGVETEAPFAIALLPNPTKDLLVLKGSSTAAPVKVFSADGKLVLNLAFVNGQLDVSGLAAGLYYAEVTIGSKRMVSRFVKVE